MLCIIACCIHSKARVSVVLVMSSRTSVCLGLSPILWDVMFGRLTLGPHPSVSRIISWALVYVFSMFASSFGKKTLTLAVKFGFREPRRHLCTSAQHRCARRAPLGQQLSTRDWWVVVSDWRHVQLWTRLPMCASSFIKSLLPLFSKPFPPFLPMSLFSPDLPHPFPVTSIGWSSSQASHPSFGAFFFTLLFFFLRLCEVSWPCYVEELCSLGLQVPLCFDSLLGSLRMSVEFCNRTNKWYFIGFH